MAFELIKEVKANQSYCGHAEGCIYTFTVNLPDQLGASWTAVKHMNAHISELQQQGSTLLEYRLWEDKASGTFTTDYKCEIVASASPLWLNLIILGVIAVLALLVTSWAISSIRDIVEYNPGLAWGLSFSAVAITALVVAGIYMVTRRRST